MATVENQTRGGLEGDLDARLLGDNSKGEDKEGKSKSGDLRASKRQESNAEPDYLNEEPQSLRQAVLQAKRNKKLKEEKEGKSGIIKKISSFRKGTSALLRSAWINLITSFGLTTFWIDIHVFLNTVLGDKFFCKLGEEWTDVTGAKAGGAGKTISRSAGKAEEIGCGCLNLGCLVIIIAVGVIIALMIKVVEAPFEFIGDLFGYLWDSIKGFVSSS